jgi:membrane protease YdiL (CAAX protease family)
VTQGVPPGIPPPLATGPTAERGWSLLRAAGVFYGIVVLFAFGYAVFSGTSKTLFGEQAPSGAWILGGIGVGLAVVAACHLGRRSMAFLERAADALTEVLGPVSYESAVILALLSGFAEELLFRGALWPHLGLWGTTFLFGIVHFVPRRGLFGYPVFAAIVGLLLGAMRQQSGSLLPPILAHVVINGLNLAWLEKRRRARAAAPAVGSP